MSSDLPSASVQPYAFGEVATMRARIENVVSEDFKSQISLVSTASIPQLCWPRTIVST